MFLSSTAQPFKMQINTERQYKYWKELFSWCLCWKQTRGTGVTFQTPSPLLFQNFCIWFRFRQCFKYENPIPVQTPATIIDPT